MYVPNSGGPAGICGFTAVFPSASSVAGSSGAGLAATVPASGEAAPASVAAAAGGTLAAVCGGNGFVVAGADNPSGALGTFTVALTAGCVFVVFAGTGLGGVAALFSTALVFSLTVFTAEVAG